MKKVKKVWKKYENLQKNGTVWHGFGFGCGR